MPTEINRKENIERVISAAANCFMESGIINTTQNVLAKRAGVSAKSVKRYFASREELVIRVSEKIMDEWYRQIHFRLLRDSFDQLSGLDQLEKLLMTVSEVILEDYDKLLMVQEADFYCRRFGKNKKAFWARFRKTDFLEKSIYKTMIKGVEDGSIKYYSHLEDLCKAVTSACAAIAEHLAHNIFFDEISRENAVRLIDVTIGKLDELIGSQKAYTKEDVKKNIKWNNMESFGEDFHKALCEEDIQLFLQPKFHIDSEFPCGAEVLCRWNHPQKGLLEPKDFLPQCAQMGFMDQLDHYVWEHAAGILQKWSRQGKGPIPLSVKVSKYSLYKSKIAEELLLLLEQHQVPKELFQLEIEEDSIRKDLYQAKEAINYLHDNGFTILLNDFGYGCSSISALNQLKVDILKVDMKFFSSIEEMGIGEAVLAGIIKSVTWYGIKVLAECVETREQKEFVSKRGCDLVQGFFFAKPLPLERFEERYQINDSERKEEKNADLQLHPDAEPKHNLTVLVIDDTEMERALLKKYLQDEFYVYLCESAEQGLAYLKEHRNQVNLILVDYRMPGMNGLEFLQFCQLDERLQQIPKIMITSNERAKDQVYAFKAGAYDYLLKPLLPELVKIRVRHAMEVNHKLVETEMEKQEYQHLAETDKATGVLNKMAFQFYVEKSLYANSTGINALMILDIDDFKQVNDKQGHLVGDEVIKLVASAVSSCFRSSDYIGRFGGDEFTVYMMNISDREYARRKVIGLLQKIKEESKMQLNLIVTVSIGVSYSKQADSFEQLFQRSDQALYRAKRTGKGKYVLSMD